MKALVTGCAGFIGSHICENLLNKGEKVVGVDIFTDYYDIEIKRSNLNGFKNHECFEFIEGDLVSDPINDWLDDIDCIFHTAGQPGVRGSWGDHFDLYLRNNILSTQRIIEAVKLSGKTIKIVYSSSSSVYGNTKDLPTPESTLPQPFSPYGTTKLAAENLCSLYFSNYRIPIVSLRYFTVYGPRQRPEMAFNIIIKSLLDNKPFLVYGDGSQTRDFTYVDDIVKANILAAEKPVEGMIFNIGGGSSVSLCQVFKIIHKISCKELILEEKELSKGDVYHTAADITNANIHLGYNPTVSIEEGLKMQMQWQQNQFTEDTFV